LTNIITPDNQNIWFIGGDYLASGKQAYAKKSG
jgi:hypothetical protein